MSNSGSSKKKKQTQADHARRALDMKTRAAEDDQTVIPESRMAGEGQISEERAEAPTSGALNAEGQRPVLERSRKVR